MSKRQRLSNPYAGLDRLVGLQKVETSKISRQSAHKDGKIVSHKHRLSRPPPTLRRYHWYSFLLETQLTPGPQ